MNEILLSIVNDFRNQYGANISDEEAENIRQICERKMDICKIEDRNGYLPILFEDEIKHFLFRRHVNEISAEIIRNRKEGVRNVYGMQAVPMSP